MKPDINRVYVLGLLFDALDPRRVVLIEKNRGPWWIVGKTNGIGGKIEAGESPYTAMCRESEEELGKRYDGWVPFATIQAGDGGVIHCFFGFTAEIGAYVTAPRAPGETEVVAVYDWTTNQNKLSPNHHWLIPMALHRQGAEGLSWHYDIKECME